MTGKIYHKLAFKLMVLMFTGAIISTITLIYLSNQLRPLLLKKMNELSGAQFVHVFNIYSAIIIIIPIIIFISIFLLGIQGRVKYLKYITNSLRNVKDETQLEALNLIGKDEISELAQSINIMSHRLTESFEKEMKIEQAKNELIVAVSHDLKTPLTSIIGYLELIHQDKETYTKEHEEYLNIVYEKSINLKSLIDELFDYTKLMNDYIVLDKVRFNIAILINQIVGEHIHFFNAKNIDVQIESQSQELWCEIDVQRMIRVMENIIKNAEKYSFENTCFEVSMSKIENHIHISFENVGENINNEELEKIFDKMYRLDKARTLSNEGSGLGLAISKKIIELHGGDILAECEGNHIKFNIRLQAA